MGLGSTLSMGPSTLEFKLLPMPLSAQRPLQSGDSRCGHCALVLTLQPSYGSSHGWGLFPHVDFPHLCPEDPLQRTGSEGFFHAAAACQEPLY